MNDTINESDKNQAEVLDQVLAIGEAVKKHITKNPRKVYQLIAEVTCKVTGADCAVIYPYHPSFGEFYDVENVAAYGLRHELSVEKRADKRKRLSARVHQEGEVIREDIEHEEPQMPQESSFIAREGVKSLMGLSLKIGNNILGILYVDYRKPHRFSGEEKKIIRLFGQQAAIAISNSWTSRLASIRADTVSRLKTIGQSLVAIEDPTETLDSVLEGIAHSAQEVLDADIVDFYQYIQASNEFLLPPTLVGERRHPHVSKDKIYADDVVMRAVRIGEPQYFHDAQGTSLLTGSFEVLREDAPDQRFVVREEVASSAMVPLMTADETVGVMFVNYRTPQLFGSEQRDVIESFAAQAAVAIRNARLFRLEQQQRQQSERLRKVAQIVNSTLERDEVVGLVLDQLSHVIEYDSASVQLIQGDRRILIGGRGFLLEDSPRELLRDVPQDALVSKIVLERRPLVLSNIKDEPLWDHMPQTSHINSWIGVPLIVGGEVIGLLTLDHRKAGYYTQGSGEVTAAFANQVALTIRNAELFSLEQRRSRALAELLDNFQTLHKIANDLAQQPELKQIYQLAVESALQTLHCSHSTIFVLDKKAGELVAAARVGAPQSASEVRHFGPGEGLAGAVLESGQSIRVNDAAKDERFVKGKVKSRSAPRSIVLSPIKIEDEVIGVISADKDETDGFTEHNLRVLEMLALDVGTAINVHRQLQQISNQAQALTELNELAPRLISIEEMLRDRWNLLEQIATSAQEVLGADLIDLYEYVQVENEYQLPPISVGERRGPPVLKEKVHEDDSVFQLILREEPLYVENSQVAPILAGPYSVEREGRPTDRFVVRESIQSTAAIPLRTGSETMGLMFASYRTPQSFTKEQKEIIQLFANQAALVIHYSRLFNALQRANQDLERRLEALGALNEVGQTLTSGIRLEEDEILELIYQQTRKLTGTQDMYIALYDEAANRIRFGIALEKGEQVEIESREADMERRGKTEEVIFTRESILHRTERDSRAWYELPDHAEFLGRVQPSYLGVPMIAGDRVLGMIAVYDWERECAYDEQDLQVLSTIASQAAIALDNARLYYDVIQALEHRVEALSALNEVGQTLTSGIRLEENEILELIYQQTRKLTGTQDMYIALYDEAANRIRFGIALEKGEQVEIESREADMERRGKTEEVIFTRESILHRTERDSRAWYELPGHAEFLSRIALSWMGVPMIAGDRVLGMIAVYDWEREYAYDEQDLQVLSTIASQAAIALDNASLYYDVNQRLERRFGQMQTVQEVTNAIKTYEELPDLLRSILEVSLPRLNAQAGTIQLLDGATSELVMQAAVGPIEQSQYERISLDRGITGQAARERCSIYVPDTSQDERFLDYLGQMHSELAIPLMVGGEIIGIFNIEDPRPDAFDEYTQELAALIADQAAIVIQNARHYARAREELIATRQVAALGTATAAIQHRINNTLNIIRPNISRLRRRVDTSDATIEEVLDIIERNTRYTSDYITRIQEPLKETGVQLVDINASLREAQAQVWRQYQDRAGFGEIDATYRLDDSLPLIEAPLGQVTEVFRNLIENGYKAMGTAGGTLTLTSRRVDSWLEVEVQDTGPGIPSNILDRLFIKPVPSGEPSEGSGLGLWLSNLLLQRCAGEIIIARTGPGGTTVLVRLPVSRP
jgi:GAF domain-containing protein